MPYRFLIFISASFKIILKFLTAINVQNELSDSSDKLLNDFKKIKVFMSQFGHTFALVLSQIIAKFNFIDFSAMKLS